MPRSQPSAPSRPLLARVAPPVSASPAILAPTVTLARTVFPARMERAVLQEHLEPTARWVRKVFVAGVAPSAPRASLVLAALLAPKAAPA